MRFIIHTGTHKTGSTSLQIYLSYNQECIKDLHYSSIGRTNDAHHEFASNVIKGNFLWVENSIKDMVEEAKRLNKTTIVISSEDFEYLNNSQAIFLRDIF